MIRLGVGVDISLEELAGESDHGQKRDAGDKAKETCAEGDGWILG